MAVINPHINFNGNAEEGIEWIVNFDPDNKGQI
jgi:hypothetical protein